MAMSTRSLLAVGVALLAAACGSVPAGTAGPAKTVTPTTSSSGGQPAAADLAHSSLLSTSWITATEGWALAAEPCGKATCTRLAHTTDGGQNWQVLPTPAARVQDGSVNCSVQACVSQISFASAEIGYLYGPALLMTTDGGQTWHADPGPQTETLTVAGGEVYRVTYTSAGCPGPCQPSLQKATVGGASWRTLIGQLNEPGRSNSAQIVASGPNVLVALYGSLAGPVPAEADVYSSADAGGTWRQTADPCGGLGPNGPKQEEDLISLAGAPGGFFAGVCAPHNIASTFIITSADAGATWRPTAATPRGQWLGFVAAVSPTRIAVASGALSGNGTDTAQLLITADGGRSWVTAATDTQSLSGGNPITGNAPAWVGFETPLVGHWLGDPHGIWTTTDGGQHWTRTAFR